MNLDQLLHTLCREVAQELKVRNSERGGCIVATGIILRVLHAFGHDAAFPLTVTAIITNDAYEQWAATHGDPTGDDDASAACKARGGLVVFVGQGPLDHIDDCWMGHLVVIIPNAFGPKHALLDVTMSQANQPEHRIVLPSLLLKVSDAFVEGAKPFVGNVNTATLIYHALPDDLTYRGTPAWQQTEGVDEAANAIIARLRSSET